MSKFRKSDTVFYSTAGGRFRARVETVHRCGDVTITALFAVDPRGADLPGYLGFKYRTTADRLYATADLMGA